MSDRGFTGSRPAGPPLMHQSWGTLLFLHWPVPVEDVRPLVPEQLEIDTYEGNAWVGVIPFTMWGIRPGRLPGLPGLRSHELNVRTYVQLDGVAGVWFFSLDASNPLVVWGARLMYGLPYFRARMDIRREMDGNVHYVSQRRGRRAPVASFEARWTIGEELPRTEPGSLPFFLTERYCLYARRGDRLYRARIYHPPWPLRRADLRSFDSSMLESHGIARPPAAPLVHYAEQLDVEVWGAGESVSR